MHDFGFASYTHITKIRKHIIPSFDIAPTVFVARPPTGLCGTFLLHSCLQLVEDMQLVERPFFVSAADARRQCDLAGLYSVVATDRAVRFVDAYGLSVMLSYHVITII